MITLQTIVDVKGVKPKDFFKFYYFSLLALMSWIISAVT